LRYSLDHLFTNPQAGSRFANKTRQAIAFEQLRTQRTHLIGYVGGSFAIVDTLHFVQMVVPLSPPVQEPRRTWLVEHRNQMQKRE
jgi:hypothetical protein